MMRMLEAQAPAKQTATDTISTLSGRLASATLLEDRRAAILGLRSFAKQYPASVASGALRGLIACLTKDAEDVDTIKVVLETLLALFNPDEHSPEASDEIALWLADEFTQRQDNITILLDLLETPDFYSRLYSLQLIRAIYDARPERTQECILTAPLGTPRLVATLDDPRDAVHTEGLILLNDLSRSSTELQKLFVFENAFEKIFDMIQADGSLTQGSIIVQDCLSLLANLVRFNSSNQTTFRETGGVARFAQLLPGGPKKKKPRASPEEEDDWVSPQADKNIWGLLAILRMFLVKGSTSTLPNQNAFHKHGLLQQVLNMAFDPTSAVPIKVEALNTCADIIRGNSRIQEGFAQLQVRPIVAPAAVNGTTSPNTDASVYIIDALLDLALTPAANELFDLRFAACECIKSYFFNHIQIRTHFLKRAIGGHVEGGDETANALTTLITGSQGAQTIDPYRTWFAAILIFHLIFEDLEAKTILMSVAEGDAESGEEVVTCIQTLTANLIGSLQLGEDERISIAYLMVLSAWLFEDAAAVNDFLGEASSLQSLVQAVLKQGDDHIVTRGLCAALLGIIYEFSTKDSPVPRRDLQPILTSKLGREKYLNAIKELRHHPLVRDFEVMPQTGLGSNLPDVYFDETFIDFLKDNFSRLSRAIDRDPVIEIHQSDQGIDRDLVDSLRGQLEEKNQAIEKYQADILTLDQKLSQEQADHRRTQESSLSQVATIKKVNEDLQRNHETDLRKLERDQKQMTLELENRHNLQLAALNNKLQQASKDGTMALTRTKQEYEEKLHDTMMSRADLEKRLSASDRARQEALETIRGLEQTQKHTREEIGTITRTLGDLQTHVRDSEAQIKQLQDEKVALQETINKLKSENQDLKTKAQDQTWKVKDAEEKLRKAETSVKEKEEARAAAQTELDDLFVVLGDLEEKRTRDKVRMTV
ncbi:intracellular protein transport protein-like protein [Periconia macrospinosa]|uniref:Intracellular protein transport protein-like protein n=1 Tax=Periconia macrospinosa TaxID=97972 RepID=A0A2V1E1A8_9PLEO|nr:intracellular protein transport protein-like protein [Periconia macrospinosa]